MGKSIRVELYDEIIRHYQKSQNLKTGHSSWKTLSIRDSKNKTLTDLDQKHLLLQECIKLEKMGYLKIKWLERNNIIDNIQYHIDFMSYYYEQGTLKDNSLHNKECLKLIKKNISMVKQDWIRLALEQFYHAQTNLVKIDKNKVTNILIALLKIDEMMNMGKDKAMRVFSKECYNDSKFFEKEVKSTIVSYIKKYYLDEYSAFDESQILNSVGINKGTLELIFKGAIIIELQGEKIDLSFFEDGIPILNRTLKKITKTIMKDSIKRVISIENKTNFLEATYDESILYIYTHGFPTHIELSFINTILSDNPDVEMYHFSDIDLGGFKIFEYLQRNLNCSLIPKQMAIEQLIEYYDYCESIDENYIKKLKKLDIPVFKDVIEYMIKNKVRLEQEALLIENVSK
ncbi:Wadjet anti-phage system protein JetD domain-containing protein [Beduini massiliensis]|uniref:Wadjet anti-phage system protein JetD domain-containing protein n=1 Tax=Beduini massiliensis TaxID=1585974 RepID=UPI00059AAB63|nr:Wadjet anti-phage system protein JetD domain-containing protein [Beduini massiliensis]